MQFKFINFLIEVFQKIVEIFNYLFTNTINEKKFLQKSFSNTENLTIVDIGANFGTFSKKIDRFFKNKTLSFHLFEPDPKAFETLTKKFRNNKFKINNLAISDTTGEQLFYSNILSSQSSLLENSSILNTKTKEIIVNTSRLDNYIKNNDIEKIHLLKIDVEGHEENVINSIGDYLNTNFINNLKIEIQFLSHQNLINIFNKMYSHNYELIGFSNLKYNKNRLLFVDAYFSERS